MSIKRCSIRCTLYRSKGSNSHPSFPALHCFCEDPSPPFTMHFIAKIGVASALANLASAIPADYSPVEKRGLAFTVDETIAKSFILSGPASVAKVYGKYGKKAPKDVTAAAANNDGTVTASPEQYDSEYLCPVSIGGQILNLDFDTGSSDLSVASTTIPRFAMSLAMLT